MSERKAIFRPLVLALIVGAGFAVAWAMVFFWCYAIVETAFQPSQPYDQVRVSTDGSVVESRTRVAGAAAQSITTTLDEEPVSEDEDPPGLRFELDGAALTPSRQLSTGPYPPGSWSSRITRLPFGRPPISLWYLVHDGARRGRAYLVGYGPNSKLLASYIGRSGFRADQPPPEDCFEMDGDGMNCWCIVSGTELSPHRRPDDLPEIPSWMVYLALDDRLVEVDLVKRKVRTVLEEKGIVSLGALSRALRKVAGQPQTEPQPLQRFLAVCMKDRVAVIHPISGLRRDYMLPADLHEDSFRFYELLDDTALIQLARRSDDGPTTHVFRWINTEGETLREEQFVLGPREMGGRAMSCCIATLATPAPAVLESLMLATGPADYLESGKAEDYAGTLGLILSAIWPELLLVNFLGAISAWFCYRRQKRYAQPWTRTWVVFVFLFGVPGLVGYLFHRRWPPRLPCPECDAPAPRDREACAACGKQFAPPAPKGIEVFA